MRSDTQRHGGSLGVWLRGICAAISLQPRFSASVITRLRGIRPSGEIDPGSRGLFHVRCVTRWVLVEGNGRRVDPETQGLGRTLDASRTVHGGVHKTTQLSHVTQHAA